MSWHSHPANVSSHASWSSTGRQALRVELEHGLGPEAMFQKPTFVITSAALSDGIVEVDILDRRSRGAQPAAKASAGIAYKIDGSARAYEKPICAR